MESCGIFLHKAIVKVESKKASGDARICSPLRFSRIGDESLRHGTRSCIESKPQRRGVNNTHHDNDDDDDNSSSHATTRHERSSASEKNSFLQIETRCIRKSRRNISILFPFHKRSTSKFKITLQSLISSVPPIIP